MSRNNRSGSQKFLLGESYGGLRAAKTARALLRDQGVAVSGIVMLSPLLEGWLTFGDDNSALRAALQLPSLAAAELERKKTFTMEALAAAEKFAMTDYLTTLAGKPPQGDAGRAFYKRVAEMTGLTPENMAQSRGFVNDFVKSLRVGKIVSRYDADFAIDDPFPERRSSRGGDPILDGVLARLWRRLRRLRPQRTRLPDRDDLYAAANEVSGGWDCAWRPLPGQRGAPSARCSPQSVVPADDQHGTSDMVTPYGTTRYVLDHIPPIGTPNRAQLKLYRGGHMFYIDPQWRKAFSTDAAAFYRGE